MHNVCYRMRAMVTACRTTTHSKEANTVSTGLQESALASTVTSHSATVRPSSKRVTVASHKSLAVLIPLASRVPRGHNIRPHRRSGSFYGRRHVYGHLTVFAVAYAELRALLGMKIGLEAESCEYMDENSVSVTDTQRAHVLRHEASSQQTSHMIPVNRFHYQMLKTGSHVAWRQ